MDKKNQPFIIKELIKEPVPLYEKNFPLILFWSPKSGCTSLMKWFFFQIGALEEATEYNPWVHSYRMDVYQKPIEYGIELRKSLRSGNKVGCKLVRNPYKRAVSSFFALLSNETIMAEITENPDDVISFKQFLYQIKKIGVGRDEINIHLARQYSEGEQLFIQKYIKLEYFEKEIRDLETRYSLIESPLTSITNSTHHFSGKMKIEGSFAEVGFTPFFKKYKTSEFSGPFPTYESFYDQETMDLVRELFKPDFGRYGYNPYELT